VQASSPKYLEVHQRCFVGGLSYHAMVHIQEWCNAEDLELRCFVSGCVRGGEEFSEPLLTGSSFEL